MAAFRIIFGCILIAMTSVVFAISFAAIVYAGELSAFLDRGIGLTLIAAALMGLAGAFLFSLRGTIAQPQDVTAILLSAAAARFAAAPPAGGSDALFATIVGLLALAGISAGVLSILLGRLRLAFAVKFIPYPVLGGFLAATGYLLTIGAVGMMFRTSLSIWSLGSVLEPARLAIWLPWILAAAATVALTRKLRSSCVLPACILAAALAFYAWLALSNTGLDAAAGAGLLLGPFPETGFLGALDPGTLALADWGMIRSEAPVILAVAGMIVLGGMLNVSGLELVKGARADLDRDLVATGTVNILAGAAGGLPGFILLGESILAWRLGLGGALAGISAAAGCLLAALFGAGLLSVLPIGLFAMVIAYLGLDLLYSWLWAERRRLPAREYAVIALIILTAALIGFLEALAVGTAVSMLFFILSYSELGFLRARHTLASCRSRTERPAAEIERLTRLGDGVVILELAGYLFFGSASRLQNLIEAELAQGDRGLRSMVLDFRRVRGIDASAMAALDRIVRICRGRGVALRAGGLSPRLLAVTRRYGGDGDGFAAILREELDEVLAEIEDGLLAETSEAASAARQEGFLDTLSRLHPEVDCREVFETVDVADGARIIRQGAASDELFVLLSGGARAVLAQPGQPPVLVARFRPGALIGEMAYFGGMRRSADVFAEGEASLLRMAPDELDTGDRLPADFLASFHRLGAACLSRRLHRYTRLAAENEP